MTDYQLFQADAFTNEVFKGNPAAVMPLEAWLPDEVLQKIAIENNLAETAYVIKRRAGEYDLRWFTRGKEVELCGHATLAPAHILYTELDEENDRIKFKTRSGDLFVSREAAGYVMDFPAYNNHQQVENLHDEIEAAVGHRPKEVWSDAFLMAVFEDAQSVRNIQPNHFAISNLPHHGHDGCVLITAPGDGKYDFVSRFFAPEIDIPEDPVTGSAHCMTSVYWAKKLVKNQLLAFQASPRGGEVHCTVEDDRIVLRGQAVTYLRGRISF